MHTPPDDDFEKEHSNEDPPEPYNTWDEYFEAFDRQLEKGQPITVRSWIGNPEIRPVGEIPDSELEDELDKLIELLYTNNIVIEFIHDIKNRDAYAFITEELLNETMDDVRIPDMYSHFIYEEFHPNDEDDIELWTGEFLDTLFKQGTEGLFIPMGDKELYNAHGNIISQEEFKKQIDEFHALYPIITEYKYEVMRLNIEEDYATVEVDVSWAGLNRREQAILRHHGPARLRLKRSSDIGWDIIQAIIVGWNSLDDDTAL
jgi:hypothetical protein